MYSSEGLLLQNFCTQQFLIIKRYKDPFFLPGSYGFFWRGRVFRRQLLYIQDRFVRGKPGRKLSPPVLNVKPNELWLEPNEQRGGRDVAIMKPLDSGWEINTLNIKEHARRLVPSEQHVYFFHVCFSSDAIIRLQSERRDLKKKKKIDSKEANPNSGPRLIVFFLRCFFFFLKLMFAIVPRCFGTITHIRYFSVKFCQISHLRISVQIIFQRCQQRDHIAWDEYLFPRERVIDHSFLYLEISSCHCFFFTRYSLSTWWALRGILFLLHWFSAFPS